MGLVVDLRSLLLDNSEESIYSETDLTAIAETAIREICLYSGEYNYNLVTLNEAIATDPTYGTRTIYSLALQLCQIKVMMSAGGNPDDYIKFVTQDTTIDPGDAGTRLSKFIILLQKEFERALKKWIGLDAGAWVWRIPEGTF